VAEPTLLQLAQELEWLGCELEYHGQQHAMLGYPESGPTWETFCKKRIGVQATADKIEHELKNGVRYKASGLKGAEFPPDESSDSVAALLGALEEIKHSSVVAVEVIPSKVRAFTGMIEEYLRATGELPG
jgi:hypothetical protein